MIHEVPKCSTHVDFEKCVPATNMAARLGSNQLRVPITISLASDSGTLVTIKGWLNQRTQSLPLQSSSSLPGRRPPAEDVSINGGSGTRGAALTTLKYREYRDRFMEKPGANRPVLRHSRLQHVTEIRHWRPFRSNSADAWPGPPP
jgi:hypothetical protein